MMTEFENWLLQNEQKFKTYSVPEIAAVAVACGFSREEVATWEVKQTA